MARAARRPGHQRLLMGALVLLTVGAAVLVIGRSWFWSSAVQRPDPTPVLRLAEGQIVGGVAVEDSVVVVLSEADVDGNGRTTLIRLDLESGAERERVVLGPWTAMDEVAEVDGDLVLRLRGRLPGVPGILLPAAETEDAASFETEVWLVIVDGATLTPIRQYHLPPFQESPRSVEVDEPLVVIDGVYWMLGAGSRRARIDLRSGATWFVRDVFARPISGVIELDGQLVVLAWGIVRVIDLDTGDIAARFQAEGFPPMLASTQPVDFRAHENEVWVAPLVRDVDDLPVRLDLETGELVEDRPSTPIPALVFESGGSRWELVGRRVVVGDRRVPTPEPEDRWRQVDPETNEVLARFDLGSWRPIFATPGALWITAETGARPGSQLARIPLGRSE